ncbi:50S ribosomal protein L9 [Candidatus Aerophobetes bacterium]|uniref:Large ribosomal subunit protein bL9 n=1 Tax=Aerophobetes bacterium TaxID=2030807 RepID=A0A523QM91_UNCAE|nr:MAG: 50S ribosomal protein L9 [Candidatus Aerophobetes bacterium]
MPSLRSLPEAKAKAGPGEKVKVILEKDVAGLGEEGTVVEVADGYARNYLLPKGVAHTATPGNIRKWEEMKKVAGRKNEKGKQKALKIAEKLKGVEIVMEREMGEEGKLFGAVTTQDIAEEIRRKFRQDIDHRKVELEEPIRVIGLRQVILKLHPQVKIPLKVEVKKK